MTAEITLACGLVALIDKDDLPLLACHKWHRLRNSNTTYARSSMKIDGVFKTVLMHRFLMSPGLDLEVDHKNHNGLDNRRENLRIATSQENCRNKLPTGISGFVGVKRSGNAWHATICPNNKEIFLGQYQDPVKAASVYNSAAKTIYGEFASFNDCGFADDLYESLIDKRLKKLRCQDELILKFQKKSKSMTDEIKLMRGLK